MFTLSVIKECLDGLVGFAQPLDPAYPALDSSLLASLSGITVQSVHPLCAMENIYNVAPEFDSFEYPAWTAAPAYEQGVVVMNAGKAYAARTAIAAAVNSAPSATPASWELINPLSAWIKGIYGQSCANLMNTLIREKKLHTMARTLLESQELYRGYGALTDKIIKRGRFVGFELGLALAQGVVVRIDKIGLQSDTIQALDFYLYNSSQSDPIAVFNVNFARRDTFSWQPLTDAIVGYMGKDTDSDSVWYLGYYEDDVQGQIINKPMNLSSRPCITCDSYNIDAYNKWSRYTYLQAVEVPPAALALDRTLFDTSKLSRTNTNNWGMNISLSVMCDLSAIACTNKMLLADALAMQLALDFMQIIAFNTRTNAISEKTKQLAMAELDSTEKSGSFKLEYLKAVRALGLDLSGLNSVCLPCSTKSFIKKSAI